MIGNGVTHSPGCFTSILTGCSEDECNNPTVDVNVICIATRDCSVGKGSDELASQHESEDMSKGPSHN